MPITTENLIARMTWVRKNGLAAFSYEEDGNKVSMVSGAVSPSARKSPPPAPTPAIADETPAFRGISAPLGGVCYLADKPGARPFVTVGDRVSKGQTVCLIEAMKIMTAIAAEQDGVIAEILIEDGDQVDAAAMLMKLADE
ncbi:MAG: biotin/lipoyl-containing protein [Martelella sp.]|uniref:acetyl-CoA carboxylase biotin carboxyl carrier protein n=1 Tax=Martelella sp. TaxID=1969699 RepID=UPI0032425D7B